MLPPNRGSAPGPQSVLGQIEVSGHRTDAAVAAVAQLDDLSLELRSDDGRARGFFLSMVSMVDIRWDRAPGGGCPSDRWKPTRLSGGHLFCVAQAPNCPTVPALRNTRIQLRPHWIATLRMVLGRKVVTG